MKTTYEHKVCSSMYYHVLIVYDNIIYHDLICYTHTYIIIRSVFKKSCSIIIITIKQIAPEGGRPPPEQKHQL